MHQRTNDAPVDAPEQLDDVELLVRISDQARDQRDAELAFNAFFERHSEFLRLACIKYRCSHTSCGAEDVVNLTMVEVYRGNAVFAPPANADRDHVRRALRAWLIGVAKNLYHAQIRKLRFDRNVIPFDENLEFVVTPETFQDDDGQYPPVLTSDLRNKILQFRDSLPTIDQLIFDRSIDYYDPVLRQFNVPPQAARDISEEVGKSIAAVRKRRERMMAALRSSLSPY